MIKPVLVIMAAGMGSRYGGLKQIDKIDQVGHAIIDFSVYDAKLAGFETVIFVIKKENEEIFKERVGTRLAKHINVLYAYQELSDLPKECAGFKERIKPWGTAHAIYCCRHLIKGPFAIINADDFYGREAFEKMYQYLITVDDRQSHYAMMGYHIEKTLSEHGSVARGICEVDAHQQLQHVVERTQIRPSKQGAQFMNDDGKWIEVPKGTVVSMNFWGLTSSFIKEVTKGLPRFINQDCLFNPLKCEYYIPAVIEQLLHQHIATVKVLPTSSKWYGVTYQEDKAEVTKAIQDMKHQGIYPQQLWGEYDD